MSKISIDLGSGPTPKNIFNTDFCYGIDIRSTSEKVLESNLIFENIPFESDSIDYITAFDFLEHIPRILCVFNKETNNNEIRYPFIKLMNEIWRVLKHNGIFLHKTPIYPYAEAFQDPTHVNIMTEKTIEMYFNDYYPVANIYGFNGGFKMITSQIDNSHLIQQISKSVKPNLDRFNSVY